MPYPYPGVDKHTTRLPVSKLAAQVAPLQRHQGTCGSKSAGHGGDSGGRPRTDVTCFEPETDSLELGVVLVGFNYSGDLIQRGFRVVTLGGQ